MSKALKYTFLIHAVVTAVIGVLLFLIPGRFLSWVGWGPIEPVINRLFGAAILGLSWGSFRGWRASTWAQVAFLVEMEALFCILACVAVVRHLLLARYPLIVWLVLAVFLVFGIAWIVLWVQQRQRGEPAAP